MSGQITEITWRGPVDLRHSWKALVKVAVSLLCGGVFYFAWMASFILATRLENSAVETVLWVLAPVITAVGFAAGIAVFERSTGADKTRLLRIFVWPLIGCAIGAGVVYWVGPMLIVFGMFAAGTARIVLREVIQSQRR